MLLNRETILGIPFVSADWQEVRTHLASVLSQGAKELWLTVNPEIIERSFRDHALRRLVCQKAVVFPDGIGVLWAADLFRRPLKQRLSGIDMIGLFKDHTVFLLGARPSVVQKAAERLQAQGLRIVGHFHGYFDKTEEAHVVDLIHRTRPEVLLVGLGMGKQEQWLAEHFDRLPVNIALTVGGSFDIISGEKQRAPEVVQQYHLEWLYRLIQEPQRFGRQLMLFTFVMRVLVRKVFGFMTRGA